MVPPMLCRDGCRYLLANNQHRSVKKRGSKATMSPSQTLDSCVFHCKSAMKSSTLIWQWMWNFQPCNAHEWTGRWSLFYFIFFLKKKVLKTKRKFKTLYIHAYCVLIFLANVSSGAHLRQISPHCHSIHFHSQPKPYFFFFPPRPPLLLLLFSLPLPLNVYM